MRLLDKAKIPYEPIAYDIADGKNDGVSVAGKLGLDANTVFKTLVALDRSGEALVFVIPVCKTLDMRKAASAAHVKHVDMLPQARLLPLTGYVHGGCSPLGMKKRLRTFIDGSAFRWAQISVSGGQIGLQIRIAPGALQAACGAQQAELTVENG